MTTATPPSAAGLRDRAGSGALLVRAGRIAYTRAWDLQKRLVDRRGRDELPDTLLLVEHPPVYTLGKRTDRRNLVWDQRQRERRGIELVEVDRGGDVTYHGPGQLVGYPILRLASTRAVVGYVRSLEEVLIRALGATGVTATRVEGYTGVWVGDLKVAAIGVRVAAGGITSHGFALNVSPDLAHYAGIVPCGITDRGICSLASLGIDTDLDTMARHVCAAFTTTFDAALTEVPLDVVDGGAQSPPTPTGGPPELPDLRRRLVPTEVVT